MRMEGRNGMSKVIVDGLDIELSRTITTIEIMNATSLVRTSEGMQWNGSVHLKGSDGGISTPAISRAIRENSFVTFEELDELSQSTHSKDYLELTVEESQTIQGNVMAGKMIAGINNSGSGLLIEDISELVTKIVEAIA